MGRPQKNYSLYPLQLTRSSHSCAEAGRIFTELRATNTWIELLFFNDSFQIWIDFFQKKCFCCCRKFREGLGRTTNIFIQKLSLRKDRETKVDIDTCKYFRPLQRKKSWTGALVDRQHSCTTHYWSPLRHTRRCWHDVYMFCLILGKRDWWEADTQMANCKLLQMWLGRDKLKQPRYTHMCHLNDSTPVPYGFVYVILAFFSPD